MALKEVKNEKGRSQYRIPEPENYCEQIIKDRKGTDEELKAEAQKMLVHITSSKELLRASHHDISTEPHELLRPAMPTASKSDANELLRAVVNMPEEEQTLTSP